MTNLLNNFVVQKPQTKPVQPQPVMTLDLNTQNKIQPIAPAGHMIKSRIIGSPIEYAKDFGKDILSIKKGVQGKANDHELGRLNDLAMKLGSLGLAGYLFAKNPFKMKRTMEFVGFGTFFASMALWPKLFIQAPLKARTGVDIHQKYQDSQGRKKMFFQDPQYLPWNLVGKEELNKMGDRLNVPKDIKNREEVIKQKAQKIALQGNTLWMLTAGFATPIMSALACNLVEGPILKGQEKQALAKTKEMFDHPSTYVEKFENKAGKDALEAFLKANGDKPLTEQMAKEIAKTMNIQESNGLEKAIVEDLLGNSKPQSNPVDSVFVKKLFDNNAELFTKHKVSLESVQSHMKAQGDTLVIDEKNLSSFVDNFTKFMAKGTQSTVEAPVNPIAEKIKSILKMVPDAAGETVQLSTDKKVLQALFEANMAEFDKNKITFKSLVEFAKNPEAVRVVDKTALAEGEAVLKSQVRGMFRGLLEEHNRPTVSSISDSATNLFKILENTFSNQKIVDKFVDARVGDKSETFIANQWARVNKAFIKALGVSNKELADFKQSGSIDIVEKKLAELAKNPEQYKKAMTSLTDAIAEYDSTLSRDFVSSVHGRIDEIFNKNATELIGAGFKNVSEAIVGKNMGADKAGALKTVIKSTVEDRVDGAKSCFYRMIQTMDLYRRIETGEFKKQLEFLAGKLPEALKEFKANDVIAILKDEYHGGDYNKLNDAIGTAFGKKIESGKLWNEFAKSLEQVSQSNADKIKGAVDECMKEEISQEQLVKKIIKAIRSEGQKDSKAVVYAATNFVEGKKHWRNMGLVMEALKNENPVTIEKLYNQVVSKSKQTLLSYTITDHTEKLNDVNPRTYQAVMQILFGSDFDKSTIEVIQGTDTKTTSTLLKNIQGYKEEFTRRITNWQYWYKSHHNIISIGKDADKLTEKGMKRHILVGSGIDEIVQNASNGLYNTNKWLKMFGTAFAVLGGVTLLSGFFFGKMKQEDVYAGDKK